MQHDPGRSSPTPHAVVVVRHPALEHQASGAAEIARWMGALGDAARSYGDGAVAVRREGERVVLAWVDRDLAIEAALGLARERARGLGVAVGFGDCVCDGDEVFGLEAALARRLVLLARVGEVLCTDPVRQGLILPAGVGAFLAPAALSALVGATVHVLKDYRERAEGGVA